MATQAPNRIPDRRESSVKGDKQHRSLPRQAGRRRVQLSVRKGSQVDP